MSLEQLFQTIEQRIWGFGMRIWQVDPTNLWKDEADKLVDELRTRRQESTRIQEDVRLLRERVFKNEVKAALLGSRIESCIFNEDKATAWRHAMELDALRQTLERDRNDLRAQEDISHHLDIAIQRRHHHLAALQDKLCPVC